MTVALLPRCTPAATPKALRTTTQNQGTLVCETAKMASMP